ncbi:HflC protein [Psittacicella hinzii]|uniref:Protein HflC n=1 Tax=Psittacicella hinzii TaxID=2028575 RepID=A0A3A1YA73_9GAMM|nr:protease modulator HflC [Psittacicella hinzii]RIY34226.1 HflC protein [Psittacicella hinzii]
MQREHKLVALAVLFVAVVFLLANSIFIVNEGTRAIKLRFNKVVRDGDGQVVVYKPGIHFKPPFIENVIRLDARLQTLDDTTDRFLTVEKKDVLIESYVKWKVADFGRFYTTTGGNYSRANDLLRRKINDRLRSEVGSQTISDIVSGQRSELMSQAKESLNAGEDGASTFGIEVIDVRVVKIELPTEVADSIYQRMRAERMAVAGEHRAQGQEQAQVIMSQTDRNVTVILSEANLEAAKIRAQADAQANEIYNATYGQNLELFNFLQNMEAYKTSLANNNSVLLINPEKDSFFQYLFNNSIANTNTRPNLNVTVPPSALPSTPVEPVTPTTPAAPATPAPATTPANN